MTAGVGDDPMRSVSEMSGRVAQTGEPVEVARRGVPVVHIHPVGPEDGTGSTIWVLRDRFVEEHGDLEADLELPPRTVERLEIPF